MKSVYQGIDYTSESKIMYFSHCGNIVLFVAFVFKYMLSRKNEQTLQNTAIAKVRVENHFIDRKACSVE